MPDRSVAIRLGTTGKAQVVADLNEIGDSGDASAKRWAKSYERAGEDVEAAIKRQANAAAKLAAIVPQSAVQMQIGDANGTGFGQWEGSARQSAAAFRDLLAAEEALEARTRALVSAIDPAYAAQQRFDREMAEAKSLIGAGAISLDQYCDKLRIEQAALDQSARAHGRVGGASGQARQSTMMLGQQLQDFSVQVSTGGNVTTAFAQQVGQASFALAGMEGKAGAVGAFLGTGWGTAILVALTVLTPLVGKLLEGNNALDDAVEKLRKHAAEGDTARQAQVLFGRSAEGVTAAIREQEDALRKAADGERTAAERANIRTRVLRDQALAIRDQTAAMLEQQRVQTQIEVESLRTRASAPGQRGENASLGLGEATSRLAGINARIAENSQRVAEAERVYQESRVALAQETAVKVSTAEGRINREYDAQERAARARATAAARRGEVVSNALTNELGAIRANREAALQAEREEEARARKKTTVHQFGREVNSTDAAAIARAAGFQVNSADRSHERQTQLYNAWVAAGRPKDNPVAKPGTSAHERGNALDLQYAAGVTVAKIRSAFASEGVRLTKVFAERGHWHVEWAPTAEQRQAGREATKEIRDAASAQRELNSDLAEVVKSFDPAKAAAQEYQQMLEKIDKLVAGGRLSQIDADVYKLAAFHEEQARRAADAERRATAIFGSNDDLFTASNASYNAMAQAENDANNAKIEQSNRLIFDGISELRETGGQMLDELFDTSRWSNWGDIGKSILNDLKNEFIKLAILNPLKNMINGDDKLPTIGTAIANIGKIVHPGHNASGTEHWSGGATWIAENGPELVNLPQGTKITPAAETRRLMAGNGHGAPIHNHFDLRGAVVLQDLLDQMNDIGNGAAVRGASGGSALARQERVREASRQLA